MKTDKMKVIMMFYPMDWGRHAFDYFGHTEVDGIVGKVKELQAEYPTDVYDVTFVTWGEVEDWVNEVGWTEDCMNDWDDRATTDEYLEYMAMIEGKDIDANFIMGHWCVGVSEDVKSAIERAMK